MGIEKNCVIFGLVETHLTENIRDAEVKIEGYSIYRRDRAAGIKKGGAAIYIKENCLGPVEVLSSGSTGALEWITINIWERKILFSCVYRPPTCPTADFEQYLEALKRDIERTSPPLPNIVIAGDFNFPIVDWASREIHGGAEYSQRQAELLLNLMNDEILEQYVVEPTRGNNILDLIITNNEDMISEITTAETIMSDHKLLIIETLLLVRPQNPAPRQGQSGLGELNFTSNRVDWASLSSKLAEVRWETLFAGLGAEEMHEKISEVMLGVCREEVPLKRRERKIASIPRDRRILMRKRTRTTKKMRASTNDSNRARLRDKILNIENQIKISHQNETRRAEERAIVAIQYNNKYFFDYARPKSISRNPVGPLKSGDNVYSEPEEMGAVLAENYEAAYTFPKYSNQENVDWLEEAIGDTSSAFQDFELTEEDISASVRQIANGSSPGPDCVPAIFLKNCEEQLRIPIAKLWRKSLETGVIPKVMKRGVITPIYKGGDRYEAKNYRPVALTSHIVKVFERIITSKLTSYLEGEGLMNREQHGFRRYRSCASQLIQHHQDILEALGEGHSFDTVYLDFSKAFDKVDHGILLRKLHALGVGGYILRWVHSFLSNREQAVAVEGCISAYGTVKSGVPQGSVLGPLLFLVHISDINATTSHTTVRSFADDTRVGSVISKSEDITNMQLDLENIYHWAITNNMEFNETKFEHMLYGNSLLQARNYRAPDGSEILKPLNVRDLGVIMSTTIKFDEQLVAMVKKARQMTGWVLRVFETRSVKPMLILFKAMIIPLLEYCCILWSPYQLGKIRDIEGVQRSFTYKLDGMRDLNYWQRLSRLNLYSLERRRERYMIIYIWKIIKGLSPNIDGTGRVQTYTNSRYGLLCRRPPPIRGAASLVTLRENSFAVQGPRLFNCVSREIREYEGSLDGFKRNLDNFLREVPDKPSLPHYAQSVRSNTLVDQVAQLRLENMS